MFIDPAFRTAFVISLLAHVALVAPRVFPPPQDVTVSIDPVDLNYIVIEQPRLTIAEEIFEEQIVSTADPEPVRPDATPVSHSGQMNEVKEIRDPRSETQNLNKIQAVPDNSAEYEAISNIKKQEALLKYYNLVREKIRGNIHPSAIRGGEGTAKVAFTLDPAGNIRKINCITSGISSSIKQKTLKGIARSQPFPPFPEELGTLPLNFSITIIFTPSN